MIRSVLLLLLMFSVQLSVSQNKTKQEVLQLMAEDTCECIKNDSVAFAKDVSLEKKEMALGLCIFNSYNKRKDETNTFKGDTFENIEEVAEQVGMLMISVCGSEFMAIFSSDELYSLATDEDEDMPPPPPAPKNENDFNMEVTLSSLHNDAISHITVKDEFGKEHKFVVIEQFEGYDLLKTKNFSKPFRIYYREQSFFDLSEKRYVTKKVVKYLEKI